MYLGNNLFDPYWIAEEEWINQNWKNVKLAGENSGITTESSGSLQIS